MPDLTTPPRGLDTKKASCLAIIETPKGSRKKFSYDPEAGLFKLGGLRPEGMLFPFDFGFVSQVEEFVISYNRQREKQFKVTATSGPKKAIKLLKAHPRAQGEAWVVASHKQPTHPAAWFATRLSD